jgi:CRISPR-associated protein (TIGR02584 family)
MSKRCYVIATLGTSPAVLTELLYALVAGEGLDVVGLEVWTTGPAVPSDKTETGLLKVEQFIENGAWGRLRASLGDSGTRIPPAVDVRVAPDAAVAEVLAGRRGAGLAVFGGPASPLNDVRNAGDAFSMDTTLFERVQALTRDLPEDVLLIGSLAGGRKTMSAGLQGAFSMLGRRQDRLVHVLLHPLIEAGLRPRDGAPKIDYEVPRADVPGAEDVPFDKQIELHDVHFPILRELMERASYPGFTSAAAFLQSDYKTFLKTLRNAADARATLARHQRRAGWLYEVKGGDAPGPIELTKTQGLALAGVVALGGEASYEDLGNWMRDHGWKGNPSAPDTEMNTVGQTLGRVKDALAHLGPRNLGDFCVTLPGRRGSVAILPAARSGRIEVNTSDLEI